MTAIPGITLNDGKTIPQIGYGVWEVPNDTVSKTVVTAVEADRHAQNPGKSLDQPLILG